jgi:hypothetical protein
VDPAGIPETLPERMDRFRTLLSGRHILIALDDAANEQQLRPLLPGSPTCAVIVTSRSRLPGLAAADLVELEMLSESEATELLARVAGEERIRSAPDAAAQIVACCGQLRWPSASPALGSPRAGNGRRGGWPGCSPTNGVASTSYGWAINRSGPPSS